MTTKTIDVQGFRLRHQVESIGILGGINRAHASWMCSACGCTDQLVGWRNGELVARECLKCQALDTRQLNVFTDLIPDEVSRHG